MGALEAEAVGADGAFDETGVRALAVIQAESVVGSVPGPLLDRLGYVIEHLGVVAIGVDDHRALAAVGHGVGIDARSGRAVAAIDADGGAAGDEAECSEASDQGRLGAHFRLRFMRAEPESK